MIGNAIDRLLLAVSFRNLLNSAKRCRSEHSGFIHSRVERKRSKRFNCLQLTFSRLVGEAS
jgi:hypothetical protein